VGAAVFVVQEELMQDDCVVVADGARARFLFVMRGRARDEATVRLEEVEDLINPVRQMTDTEVFSEPRPGIRARLGGQPQTLDDHREHHDEEFERRFARMIAAKLMEVAVQARSPRVVLVAEPKMLGYLRKELPARTAFSVDQVAKDLSKLSFTELHDHLALEGLIPPRYRFAGGPPWRRRAMGATRGRR
jgi:protein required for attachment to host cells